jgi:hypothetical protein
MLLGVAGRRHAARRRRARLARQVARAHRPVRVTAVTTVTTSRAANHFALICWAPNGSHDRSHGRRDPFSATWTYWPTEADAYTAAELLDADGIVWTVCDAAPARRRGWDGAAFDKLINELRRDAREGAAIRARMWNEPRKACYGMRW